MVFSENSSSGQTPFYGSSIRSEGNYHRRDSWKIRNGTFYNNNKPTNRVFNLTPLFGSTNTKDIDSITKRLPGAPPFGQFSENTVSFGNVNVTNTPTMAVFTNGVLSASKTIRSIFMNDPGNDDEIGIRGAGGSNLRYTTNDTFRWFGSGIMDKPIDDFHGSFSFLSMGGNAHRPYFARGGVNTVINSRVIPEPEGIAFVAGLILLFIVVLKSAYEKRNGK